MSPEAEIQSHLGRWQKYQACGLATQDSHPLGLRHSLRLRQRYRIPQRTFYGRDRKLYSALFGRAGS